MASGGYKNPVFRLTFNVLSVQCNLSRKSSKLQCISTSDLKLILHEPLKMFFINIFPPYRISC